LEAARTDGIIGHSLDAEVILSTRNGKQEPALTALLAADTQKAEDILIVSQLSQSTLAEADLSGERSKSFEISDETGQLRLVWSYHSDLLNSVIAVAKARGEKCERCWKYDVAISKDSNLRVCPRCAAVLNAGVSA
jgi:isoleucyl-tRNA synthetase